MLGALLSLGSAIVDGAKGYLTNRQKVKAAEADNRARLLQSQQTHNENWEMASLAASGKGLKWASFVMFSLPLVWAIFDPASVATYFNESIDSIPDWWSQSWVAITGSIWGISVLKDAVPHMIGGIKRAIKS